MTSDKLERDLLALAARHEDVLVISAGAHTEDLVRFVTHELPDDVLDEIDVERVLERRDDLASEPVTAAVLLALGGTAVVTVGRIIERWLEARRQREQMMMTIEAFQVSPEAGALVSGLVLKHAEVSVSYRLDSAESSGPRRTLD